MNLVIKKMFWFSLLAMFAAGAVLQAGDSRILSKQELKTLVGTARTAEDHERLAQHFSAKADELEAEAKEHQELAAQYKARPTIHELKHPMSPQTAGHCVFFADDLHKAAGRARQMAVDHREMAKQSPK